MVKRLTVVKRLTFVHSWRIQVSPSLCRSSSDPGICPSNGLGGRSVFRGLRSERDDIKRCTAMARCAKRDRGAGCERGWRSCEAAGGSAFGISYIGVSRNHPSLCGFCGSPVRRWTMSGGFTMSSGKVTGFSTARGQEGFEHGEPD